MQDQSGDTGLMPLWLWCAAVVGQRVEPHAAKARGHLSKCRGFDPQGVVLARCRSRQPNGQVQLRLRLIQPPIAQLHRRSRQLEPVLGPALAPRPATRPAAHNGEPWLHRGTTSRHTGCAPLPVHDGENRLC